MVFRFYSNVIKYTVRNNISPDKITYNGWFNTDCFEKRSLFYNALNVYRKNKTDENRRKMVSARSQYKSFVRKCKFNHDYSRTKKLSDAKFRNAKLYWQMLKESACMNKSKLSLSVFEMYFKSVNNPNTDFFTPDEDILCFVERYENNEFDIMFQELNVPFTNNEIFNAIKQLNSNKSSGPVLYINEFFIHGNDVLAPYILRLFHKIFDLGYFPENWSEGYVIPLQKKRKY